MARPSKGPSTARCRLAGFRADVALIDDPVRSREDADSETVRDKTREWFCSDLSTRTKMTWQPGDNEVPKYAVSPSQRKSPRARPSGSLSSASAGSDRISIDRHTWPASRVTVLAELDEAKAIGCESGGLFFCYATFCGRVIPFFKPRIVRCCRRSDRRDCQSPGRRRSVLTLIFVAVWLLGNYSLQIEVGSQSLSVAALAVATHAATPMQKPQTQPFALPRKSLISNDHLLC